MKKCVLFFSLAILLDPFCAWAAVPWWDNAYDKRTEIPVINNSPASQDAIPVTALLKPLMDGEGVGSVTGTLSNGNDARVVYWNGISNTEIDRVFAYESVVFKLQEAIPANNRTSGTYWLYWKNPSAGPAPALLSNVYPLSYTFNSGLPADWGTSCSSGATVSAVSGAVQVNTTNTLNSGCSVYLKTALTNDARRLSFRFKTAGKGSHAIKLGFTWQTANTTDFANFAQIEGNGSTSILLGYRNASMGTQFTNNYEQQPDEPWAANEWYSVIYEMLDHSIVGRVYRESTGNLVESFTWGRKTHAEMDTENPWLAANLYFTIRVSNYAANVASSIQIDDVGIGIRKMPDVMPLYFKECGFRHAYLFAEDDRSIYSADYVRFYKSVDACQSTALLKDFSTGEYKTNVDQFSAEVDLPKFNGISEASLMTASVSADRAYHRVRSLKLTTDAVTGTERFYSLSNGTSLGGFLPGVQYAVGGCVYVPSGQGIDLNNVVMEFFDYNGATYESVASPSPTAFDTWQCLSAVKSIRPDAAAAFVHLSIYQDIPNVSIYWDKIQRDSGPLVKQEVFWGSERLTYLRGIYKRNGRLFASFQNSEALLYSDDDGQSWHESQVPWGGGNYSYGHVTNWGFSSDASNLFIGQYTAESPAQNGGGPLFRSSDNGNTFTEIFRAEGRHIHMVRYNPFNGILYATNGNDQKLAYYSTNPDGPTPTFTEMTQASPANLGLAFLNARVFMGGDLAEGNKIRITDDNTSWVTKANLGGNFDLQTWDMAYLPSSNTLFAVGLMDPGWGARRIPSILCSFDGGESWEVCYEAAYGSTEFYDGPNSTSYPQSGDYRVYFGVSNLVKNISGTLYFSPTSENSPVVDSDGDGMVNGWELQFGLDPNNPADGGLDGDGDGFGNTEEYIGQTDPSNAASVPNAQTVYDVNLQPIRVTTPPGVTVTSLTWIDPATLPASSDFFPYGLVGITLGAVQPGGAATVAVTFPGVVDPGSIYDHYGRTALDSNDHWYSLPFGSNNGDATLLLTLTDGGAGDHDLSVNGVISDLGGPAFPGERKINQNSTADQRYPWVDYNEAAGEYLAVWQDKRNGAYDDIYAVRLDRNGNRIGSDIPVSLAAGHQQRALVKAGGGGYLVVWQELKDYATNGSDIYGAWVDGTGTAGPAMAICACAGDQWLPRVGYDPATNTFLVVYLYWTGSHFDLWGTVVPAGGSGSLTPFAMVTAPGDQRAPQLGYDYENGWYYLAWNDRRSGTTYDIYGSRVTSAGSLIDGTGVFLGGGAGNDFRPTVVDRRPSAGINNHLVAWNDYRSGSQADVYGVYVDGSGAVVGGEIPISLNTGDAVHVVADVDWIRTKKSLVGWVDNRNGTDYDVYRAMVDPSGAVTGDYPVAGSETGATDQQQGQVVSYGTDGVSDYGFLQVWMDKRNGMDYDIYGIKVWP